MYTSLIGTSLIRTLTGPILFWISEGDEELKLSLLWILILNLFFFQ